VHKLSCQDETF